MSKSTADFIEECSKKYKELARSGEPIEWSLISETLSNILGWIADREREKERK